MEAAPGYEAKACYALHMLLAPLALEPEWVQREDLTRGVYYGLRPPGVQGIVSLAYSQEAETYFESRRPFSGKLTEDGALVFDGRADVVASAFFWLSGWQEIVSPARDVHGRFPYGGSLQERHNLVHIPLVDRFRESLLDALRGAGIVPQRRTWAGRSWAFCPTHDVDYLRKWRPGILYRDFVQHPRRIPFVLRQMMEGDPYRRALARMPDEVSSRGGTATYFFKTGATDEHDVPYRLQKAAGTINSLVEGRFEIGLHPSYLTLESPDAMREEKERLESVAGEAAVSVRQHYLRFDPLKTPRMYESMGFGIDSTLGFAEHEGFRRGTCLPFRLYDVEADRALEVWEMPLSVMESTLFNRRGLSAEGAVEATKRLADECRRSGGVFVALWHNTLWDEIDCPGWGRHFTDTLDFARSEGALIASLESALRSWHV